MKLITLSSVKSGLVISCLSFQAVSCISSHPGQLRSTDTTRSPASTAMTSGKEILQKELNPMLFFYKQDLSFLFNGDKIKSRIFI